MFYLKSDFNFSFLVLITNWLTINLKKNEFIKGKLQQIYYLLEIILALFRRSLR